MIGECFFIKSPDKKKMLVLRGECWHFTAIFQATNFWDLIFYNYKLLKPPKLQTNAEKSLAFISPMKPVGLFFFFSQGK